MTPKNWFSLLIYDLIQFSIVIGTSNTLQFEEDYKALDQISEHHACLHMEQLITLIKRAAEEQKAEEQ